MLTAEKLMIGQLVSSPFRDHEMRRETCHAEDLQTIRSISITLYAAFIVFLRA